MTELVDCDKQVERLSQAEAEKRDFLQRIADREEALHQANVSNGQYCFSSSINDHVICCET